MTTGGKARKRSSTRRRSGKRYLPIILPGDPTVKPRERGTRTSVPSRDPYVPVLPIVLPEGPEKRVNRKKTEFLWKFAFAFVKTILKQTKLVHLLKEKDSTAAQLQAALDQLATATKELDVATERFAATERLLRDQISDINNIKNQIDLDLQSSFERISEMSTNLAIAVRSERDLREYIKEIQARYTAQVEVLADDTIKAKRERAELKQEAQELLGQLNTAIKDKETFLNSLLEEQANNRMLLIAKSEVAEGRERLYKELKAEKVNSRRLLEDVERLQNIPSPVRLVEVPGTREQGTLTSPTNYTHNEGEANRMVTELEEGINEAQRLYAVVGEQLDRIGNSREVYEAEEAEETRQLREVETQLRNDLKTAHEKLEIMLREKSVDAQTLRETNNALTQSALALQSVQTANKNLHVTHNRLSSDLFNKKKFGKRLAQTLQEALQAQSELRVARDNVAEQLQNELVDSEALKMLNRALERKLQIARAQNPEIGYPARVDPPPFAMSESFPALDWSTVPYDDVLAIPAVRHTVSNSVVSLTRASLLQRYYSYLTWILVLALMITMFGVNIIPHNTPGSNGPPHFPPDPPTDAASVSVSVFTSVLEHTLKNIFISDINPKSPRLPFRPTPTSPTPTQLDVRDPDARGLLENIVTSLGALRESGWYGVHSLPMPGILTYGIAALMRYFQAGQLWRE